MTEAMPFLQKYDITFLRPPTIRSTLFCVPPIYRPLSRCATAPRRGAGAADAVSHCDPSREKEF